MSRNTAVLAAMLAALALTVSNPSAGADWSQWELDNSVARERDWLVIRQPGEGFCYLKQSYDPSKMDMLVKRDGAYIITPFLFGISGNVTYRIDNSEPGLISAATIKSALSIELPRNLLPALKAGRKLYVRVVPKDREPQTQVFSLLGFTAASRWLERDVCQNQPPEEAASQASGKASQYEKLLARTDADQKLLLQIAINGAGISCPAVTRTLFKGGENNGAGFWAVACTDGGNWLVRIKNDADATTDITPCEILKAIGAGVCWEKFREPAP